MFLSRTQPSARGFESCQRNAQKVNGRTSVRCSRRGGRGRKIKGEVVSRALQSPQGSRVIESSEMCYASAGKIDPFVYSNCEKKPGGVFRPAR